jgi:molecular chaperone DnaK (HSP70)
MRLGIDFGTTNSGAAFVLNGKLEHVAFGADRDYLPSSVFLKPKSPSAAAPPEDDGLLTGYAAENSYPQDPRRYWRAFKRDLGHKDSINLVDRDVNIIEMIAAVIKALKAEAENVIGPLSEAVVTLPATYGPSKEQLMREAVEQAGFEEASVEFLPEPVAAATYNSWIAQDLLGQRDGDVVLIYDLGGGTFDSTLVTRQGEQYEVMSSAGIEYCGGMDFDAMIYQRMLEIFKGKLEPILAQLREADDADSHLMQLQFDVHLQNEARKVKHELTDQENFGRMVPLVGLDYARFELNRTDFNAMIDGKVMETIECCQQLVANANISREDVTVVLLVGGSTRIPYIREAIERELGLPVRSVQQPEKAVFYGAALHGSKQPASRRKYHKALKAVRDPRKVRATDVKRLMSSREELELRAEDAAALEREVLGNTLEEISRRLEAKEQYRSLLAIAWADKRLEDTEVRQLSARARQLGLKKAEVSGLQREVMGNTLSSIRKEQIAVDRLAREHGVNLSEVKGTGSGGRITTEDVEVHVDQEILTKLLSQLRSHLDKHGDKFVSECERVAKILGSDSNWENNIRNSLKPALKAYAKGVQEEAQAEVTKLGLGLTVPPFTPKVSVEVSVSHAMREKEKVSGKQVGGALGGAAVGALIGSVIPGIGTTIGAGLGAALGQKAASDPIPDYEFIPEKDESLKNVQTTGRELRPALKAEARKYLERVEKAVAAKQRSVRV